MKLRIKEIVDAVGSLNKLFAVELPIKLSYKLSKIVQSLDTDVKLFNEKRNAIIKKYGKEDEKTKLFSIIPGSPEEAEFRKELDSLLEIETEVIDWNINLSELENESTLKLSAIDMANILKFIKV